MHSAKHSQRKNPLKTVLVVVAVVAVISVIGLSLGRHSAPQGGDSVEKPAAETTDDKGTDVSEQGDKEAVDESDWAKWLNDEQKAELEIAYEASVADGYRGTYDEWIDSEVQTRVDGNDNVVVMLPDGGEFTVTEPSTPEGDQNADDSETSDDSKTPEEDKPSEDDETDGGEEAPDTPSQDEPQQSALLSVDTVVAHKKDKQVALPIKILGNPGILGLTFSVSYDEKALTLTSVDNGKAFEGTLALTHSRTYSSGCLFTWDGVDIEPEQVRDGVALTLYFDIADDASGLHTVAVRGATGFDADLNSISITTQDGGIAIE